MSAAKFGKESGNGGGGTAAKAGPPAEDASSAGAGAPALPPAGPRAAAAAQKLGRLQVPGGGPAAAAGGQGAAASEATPPQWSPINYQQAVEQLWSSDEEGTPREPTVMGTVKRWFGGGGGGASVRPAPRPGGSAAKQLQPNFRTPSPAAAAAAAAASSGGAVSVGPAASAEQQQQQGGDAAQGSLTALRRRCDQLTADREMARADAYAEASRAVARGLELDGLREWIPPRAAWVFPCWQRPRGLIAVLWRGGLYHQASDLPWRRVMERPLTSAPLRTLPLL